MMTKGEQSFFQKDKERIKIKLRTKRKWTTDAEDIIEVYQQRTRDGKTMWDYIMFQLRDHG